MIWRRNHNEWWLVCLLLFFFFVLRAFADNVDATILHCCRLLIHTITNLSINIFKYWVWVKSARDHHRMAMDILVNKQRCSANANKTQFNWIKFVFGKVYRNERYGRKKREEIAKKIEPSVKRRNDTHPRKVFAKHPHCRVIRKSYLFHNLYTSANNRMRNACEFMRIVMNHRRQSTKSSFSVMIVVIVFRFAPPEQIRRTLCQAQ